MAPGDTDRLPPDPVIEYYKKDIDRTLLRENLKLTPEERILKLQDFVAALHELQQAKPGRPRDLNALAELEALLEERERGSGKA